MSPKDLNQPDIEGNTPLFIAIKLCKTNPQLLEVIKTMLLMGADPNIIDKYGWSPLDEAISQVNIYFF